MTVRKMFKLFFITALIMIIAAPAPLAAAENGERTVLTVGSVTFNESDTLRLIMGSVSGNEMMAMLLLSQSSLEDRKLITDQIAEAALFSEAAKEVKLDQQPDIAFQIKWQTIQTLVQAYFEKIASGWDFSSAAAEKYYNANKESFMQNEAVMAAHILTLSEADALMAAVESMGAGGFAEAAKKYSRDPNSAQNGGDLGWVEAGMMVPPVGEAIMNGKPGEMIGPVQSDYGWHIIKIGERRPRRRLTFAEAGDAVFEQLQREYIERELQKLRAKYPVTVDDEALRTLGGINAPAE